MAGRLSIKDDTGEKTIDLRADITTFGRAPENTVVVTEKEFSRRHFHIERVEAGYKVVDLESRNGTRVNGKHVNQHLLRPGDRIEVGKAVLVFQDSAWREPAPAAAQAAVARPATAAVPVRPATPPIRRSGSTTAIERRREIFEQVEERKTLQVVGWIGGLVVFAIVVLIVIGTVTSESGDVRAARDAFDKAVKLESTRPREAIALYESVPKEAVKLYREAQDRARVLRDRMAPTVEGVDRAEQAAYDALVEEQRRAPPNLEDIIRVAEDFKARYPRSPYLPRADEMLRKAREERAGGRRREVEALAKDVDAALAANEFRKAVDASNAVYEKHKLDITLKPLIEAEYKRVIEGGKKHFQLRVALAEDREKAGARDEARQIYAELIQTLGDGKVPEFETQVQTARVKLDGLKQP